MGRQWIGIDKNRDAIKIAKNRIDKQEVKLV